MSPVTNTVPVCLSIGSSDSGGGAGVQGDIKALASVGCFATTVLVGITAQNTTGVRERWPVPLPAVTAQLEAVFADLPVRAIKIGTTWSVPLIRILGEWLAPRALPVVVDPVMTTAAGSPLTGDAAAVRSAVIEYLFPIATVLTPNRAEAEILAGTARSRPTAPELAQSLLASGARAVVISARPGVSGDGSDWFADGQVNEPIPGPRYAGGADHGAGCAHSSALAGLLAHGLPLAVAVRRARGLVSTAVREGLTGLGSGAHPVDMLGLPGRAPGLKS